MCVDVMVTHDLCVFLGLIFLDLPFGIGKFEGDNAPGDEATLDRWIASIEAVNRETQSVLVAICPFQQVTLFQGIIKKYGYIDSDVLWIHKKFKSDKMPGRAGFINAQLYAVIG